MDNGVLQVIGLLGFILYFFPYLLLQLGVINGQGYLYPVLNLAAASFVLVSLYTQFNLASALIQATWILISIFGIARVRWINWRRRQEARKLAFKDYVQRAATRSDSAYGH